MPHVVLRITLTLLLLASAASAQAPISFTASELPLAFPGGSSGEMDRAVAGDLDGDGRADLVVIRGGDPIAVFGPAVFVAALAMDPGDGTDPLDVTMLPASDGSAICVTAGPSGVHRWNLVEDVFQPESLLAISCRALAVVDFAGDGDPEVVALTEDGSRVWTLDASGASQTEFVLPGAPARRLAPVRWLAGTGDQCALLRDDGVAVWNGQQTLLVEYTGGATRDLVALRSSRAMTDGLAWIDEGASGTEDRLNVVSALSPLETIPLGVSGVAGVSAADLNEDGEPEVVVLLGDGCEVRGYYGVLGSSYDPGNGFVIEAIDPGADCAGGASGLRPLLVDIDNDSDLDVVHPVRGAGSLLLGRSDWERLSDPYEPLPCVQSVRSGHQLDLVVQFEATPEGTSELEVVVFRALYEVSMAGEPEVMIEATPWFVHLEAAGANIIPEITVPLDTAPEASDDLYYFVTRLFDEDGMPGPDSIHVFQRGEQGSCPLRPFMGRKPEGFNPSPPIVFMDVPIPPGGGQQ